MNGLHPWSIMLADYARLYPMLPVTPPRNADGAYFVLPTADGWVRVLPGSPRQWHAYVKLLGSPEPHPVKLFSGTSDPRYVTIYRWIQKGALND